MPCTRRPRNRPAPGKHPDLAIAYGVTGIPNVKLFVDGQVVSEFSGVVPGHAIEEWLRESLPRKRETGIEQARRLLARGNDTAAETILRAEVQENPHKLDAKVLLARAVYLRAPSEAFALVEHIEPVGPMGELAEAIQVLASFQDRFRDPSNLPDSPARDHILRAAAALSRGNLETVLEELISSLQVDRTYLDGHARMVCVALFRFLGETNELTAKYRRKLGMILYT